MAAGALPSPCPRFATHDEWEAWHQALTWKEQLRRGDLDPPEYAYGEDETAKARERAARRRAQDWSPDPFSYSDERSTGPWPRVDQLEAPALSNSWRMDSTLGYSPAGFARRLRQVSHRELIEERLPRGAHRDAEARLAWLLEAIAREQAAQRSALLCVLRERHGKLDAGPRGATGCAMAWCQLVASRCALAALRTLANEARTAVQRQQRQLALF